MCFTLASHVCYTGDKEPQLFFYVPLCASQRCIDQFSEQHTFRLRFFLIQEHLFYKVLIPFFLSFYTFSLLSINPEEDYLILYSIPASIIYYGAELSKMSLD